MPKPSLSPTRIGAYLECAVKYRYIYFDKIGRFYLRVSPALSFGSTLHHVLQQFYTDGGRQSEAELSEAVDRKWISAGYETRQQELEHLETARNIAAGYRSVHTERLLSGVETIANEKTLAWDMGRFKLSGRVDRIDRHADGTVEVIDYKSGRLETSSIEVARSLAMNCYELILSKLYPDAGIRGTIYCLRSGVAASYEPSLETLREFEADILEIGGQILDRDWDAVRPVELEICPECEFVSRCRTYWRQQARHEAGD